MTSKRIAVIGAGNSGYSIAADLALAGNEVNLYEMPQFRKNLDPVLKAGGIELFGLSREGFAKFNKVTDQIAEAIKGVSMILVTTQSWGHEMIADLCAPYLEDGQTIVVLPGNCGSLLIKKRFMEKGIHKDIKIAETRMFPFGCRRIIGEAKAHINTIRKQAVSALPSRDTAMVLKDLEELFPNLFSAGKNIIEVALNNINPYLHGAFVLLNYRSIEVSGGEFYPFKEGLSPSVWKLMRSLGREKETILKAMGLTDSFPVEAYIKDVTVNLKPTMLNLTFQDRFITEDVPINMVLLTSLGDMIGIPTPVTKAFITLVSEIKGVDYFKEGRDMERLGISGMSIKELNEFLEKGMR